MVEVYQFRSSDYAYDQTLLSDAILDGDVLVVESEQVVGVVYQALPVAISEERGAFETFEGGAEGLIKAGYRESVRIAKEYL
jgi:hypothetical protein